MISDWTQLLRWLSMNSRYLLHNELHAQMTDQWSIWIWTPMRTIGNQLFTMPTISLFIFLFRQRTRTRISSCAVVERVVQSCPEFSILFVDRTEQSVPRCVSMTFRRRSLHRPFDSEHDLGHRDVHHQSSCLLAVLPLRLKLMERVNL